MTDNSVDYLNENHKRRLRVNCQEIDRLLAEIETILNASASKSPFPTYRDDLSPVQRKVVQDYIARIRAQMVRVLEGQHIELPMSTVGAIHAIQANLIAANIAITELKPKYMRGYGTLSELATVEFNGIAGELHGLVTKLSLYLTQELGQDFQGRLERLEQISDEIELLKRLERTIANHGLVEFRSILSTILERLEDPRFEIALFGRVSSGKSSLLNYLLHQELLPVGVNPITALPTRIVYGTIPRLIVQFADQKVKTFEVGQLAEFVSEQQNPANFKHVARLVVELPSARLKNGLVFVDTPGLGSLATAGAEETLAYLPRCDLGVVLIDAGATLTQEDLSTIRALYEATIPAYVLLSKADLLTDVDRERSLHYITKQITNQLGIEILVHPVSVIPAYIEQLNGDLEQELILLSDRHQQLAKQSIRRKIGALREGVIAALRIKLSQTEPQMNHANFQPQAVETALRQATGKFASTRTACEKLADEIGNFAESAISRSASEVATQWLSGDSQAIDPVSVVKYSLIQVSVEKAQELQGLLKQLTQALTQVLNDTRDTLDAGNMSVKGELTSSIREMPRLDMGTLALDLRRPFLLNISKQLAVHQIEKSLQQQIGTTVSEAFRSYQKLLKAWVTRTLAELQGQFDSDADTYRAQLERLTGAVGSSQQEKTAIRYNLDELNHWQDTVEV